MAQRQDRGFMTREQVAEIVKQQMDAFERSEAELHINERKERLAKLGYPADDKI
jgi:hypothetical protein